MKRDSSFTSDSELTSVRLPKQLRAEAKLFGRENDLTFSQVMRRALKRELGWPDEVKPKEAAR